MSQQRDLLWCTGEAVTVTVAAGGCRVKPIFKLILFDGRKGSTSCGWQDYNINIMGRPETLCYTHDSLMATEGNAVTTSAESCIL